MTGAYLRHLLKVISFVPLLSALGCTGFLESFHRVDEMISHRRCEKPEDCRDILRATQNKLSVVRDPMTLWHYDDRVGYQAILGHQRTALDDFEKVIDLNYPDHVGPYTRARREFGTEQWEAARMYAEAWELYASKGFPLAGEKFSILLSQGFEPAGAYLGLYLSLCETSHCPKSSDLLDKGISLAPRSFRLRVARAIHLLASEEMAKAAPDIEQVMAFTPQFAEGYIIQGSVLVRAERYEEAVAKYAKALEMKHITSDLYMERAHAFAGLNRFDEAILDLNQAVQLNKENDSAFALRAALHFMREDRSRAFTDWSSALKLNSTLYGAKLIAFYTDLLKVGANDAELYYRRAEALATLGRFDESLRDVHETLSRNPKHAEAYFVRGLCHRALQQNSQALADFKNAIQLDPLVEGAHLQLGLLYSELFRGSDPKEWSHFREADRYLLSSGVKQDQENYLRALLYASAGTRNYMQQAIILCSAAVRTEPNNKLYVDALGKLQQADAQLRNQAFEAAFWTFLGFWAIGAYNGAGTLPDVYKPRTLPQPFCTRKGFPHPYPCFP